MAESVDKRVLALLKSFSESLNDIPEIESRYSISPKSITRSDGPEEEFKYRQMILELAPTRIADNLYVYTPDNREEDEDG